MPTNIVDAPLHRGNSRVFVIENRAGPTHVPVFLSFGAAGPFEQPLGDVTRVEVPSPLQYDQFEYAGDIPGQIENGTLTLMYRAQFAISYLHQLSIRRCPYDIQVHIGDCEDPTDFDKGWKVVLMLERARSTNFKTDELGTMESGGNETVTEEVDTSVGVAYYVAQMTFAKRAESEITAQVVAVSVCDRPSCGECGSSSDGCKIVFAVTDPAGSSPGLLPEVIYTDDGYTTAGERTITTFLAGENPDDATCVGSNFVVVSADGNGMHIADKDDILDASETWQKVTSGFVALHGPTAIVSISPRTTWIVGLGGYVYFTTNPVNGVSVQDAGVATTENLNDVDALNAKYAVAVGANNAVIFTENGGQTWSSVTGPAPAVALNTVAMRSKTEWWIGTAGGELYFTLDKGLHWTEQNFDGSGAGTVEALIWASDSVGFMAHTTAGAVGRIFRTISGGNTWYISPESPSSVVPANAGILSLAVCQQEANVLYAGGKATGAVDGVLIKGTPAVTVT